MSTRFTCRQWLTGASLLLTCSLSSLLQAASPADSNTDADTEHPPMDTVEAIVPLMPIVLPVVGGVLMFLLAFIAVYMA